MLTPMPLVSREQRIRDEFVQTGPMTIPAFARHCLGAGIWAEHEIAGFALTAAQGQVRQALKAPDKTGLPFAGQTVARNDEPEDGETGPQRWAQRAFWIFDDYQLNISEGLKQRDAIHFHVVDLADECRERFGRAPLIQNPQRQQDQRHRAAD